MRVKFLPKKDIDVEICDIYEDREAVIIQHTDTLVPSCAYNVEALGFKYNLKPCAFHWPYSGIQGDDLIKINKTGVIRFGVYIPTDRYRGVSSAGVLPDYTSKTITTKVSADYYGKKIGDDKPILQQGQDLFDYTNGVKGYDVVNGVNGSEENMDFIREMDYVDKWYNEHFNRLPSSGSDRQGVIGSKEIYLSYYLGIRNTTPSSLNYNYSEVSRLDWIHRRITSRFENGFPNNVDAYIKYLKDSIIKAIENKGISVDFTHWHRAISHGGDIKLLHTLYSTINEATKEHYVWSTGYSEAVEYYWYRRMTKRVRGSFIDGSLHLIADFDDELINSEFAGLKGKLLYDRIHQPLSVKIDLKNTQFEGKEISSNIGEIISLGSDKYIVNIPFNQRNGFQQIMINTTTSPNYKNLKTPNVISYDNGIITTDQPCRAVLFKNTFNETMTVSLRKLELNITHSFEIDSNSKHIGLITEDGQSMLYDL